MSVLGNIGGIFQTFWKSILTILGALFLNWKGTITIIFLAIFLSQAVFQSIQEKNAMPFFTKAGGLLLSADEVLYREVKTIETNDWRLPSKSIKADETEGFWHDFKSVLAKTHFILQILGAGWFIYIMFTFLLKFFNFLNNTSVFTNVLLVIAFMFFFQSSYSLVLLYSDYNCGLPDEKCYTAEERVSQIQFALVPLKGVSYTIINIVNGNLIQGTLLQGAIPLAEKTFNSTSEN